MLLHERAILAYNFESAFPRLVAAMPELQDFVVFVVLDGHLL